MMEDEAIVKLLKEKDLRVTPQRLAIMKVLLRGGHYTGEQIFNEVKKIEPSISLSTVYNNLEALESAGLVRSFESLGVTWYEARLEPHINVICVDKKEIVDIDVDAEWIQELLEERGFKVISLNLVALAECNKAQSLDNKLNNS